MEKEGESMVIVGRIVSGRRMVDMNDGKRVVKGT